MFFYKVYYPSPALAPFVYNYSIVENYSAVQHRILPRPAAMLGVVFKGRMELRSAEGHLLAAGFKAGILGVQDTHRVFYKDAHTGMMVANFTTTGAAAFLKYSMDEIFNTGYSLDLIYKNSTVDTLQERAGEAKNDQARIHILESFLLSMLTAAKPDALVAAGVTAIQQQNGIIKAEQLAKNLYITSGRLEKRFRKTIGITPKRFAALIRIQTILRKFQQGQPLTTIAYEAGYFDQPHFIHDFKNFTGYTPRQLLNNRIEDKTSLPPCGFIYGSETIPVPDLVQ